ncbi:MAG: hypothetical protein HC927_12140 [Deltaproteobacteria bacterium]|nr:hypothetical protein [Deltaproteobacteria bacterium]
MSKLPDDALVLLPVGDLVLFPGMVVPIVVGRAGSIAAAQEEVHGGGIDAGVIMAAALISLFVALGGLFEVMLFFVKDAALLPEVFVGAGEQTEGSFIGAARGE